ncbi:MAG: DNA/RNA non-specific endonuclease, partial [Planctomycetota bacterium]
MKSKITTCIILVMIFFVPAYGQKAKDGDRYKEIVYEAGYEHDKWKTSPQDHIFKFRAYTTSFDGEDDNDGDGVEDRWGVPEWVAFEVRKKTVKTDVKRPRPWMSEESLNASDKNVAPKDNSYHFATTTKKDHPYSLTYNLSRGHMCPKNVANRLGDDADYNTHTVLNACPQYQWHNNGIWKDLERLTE